MSSNAPALAATVNQLGYTVSLVDTPSQLLGVTHLIIPGNGSIAGVVTEIDSKSGLRSALIEYAESKRHLLGICLGMQLLGKESAESSETKCLGILPFSSESMEKSFGGARIPHVGWNQVSHDGVSPLFHKIPSGSDFYFSHSFAVLETSNSFATTTHGISFSSSLAQGNVYGVQFHPERSQSVGAQLLKNFINLG